MMVSFDFLSNPIELSAHKPCTLCVENIQIFRKTVLQFLDGCPEDSNIIFSKKFEPFNFSGNVCFISDMFSIDFSSVFVKKLHEDIAVYSHTYLQDEMICFRSAAEKYLGKVVENFDFDFECKDNIDLVDFLKMQGVRPALSKENLLSTLLDFLILTKKYQPVKCFVLLNLHLYFDCMELEKLYTELEYRDICILALENVKPAHTLKEEAVYIVDNDLCEIFDN